MLTHSLLNDFGEPGGSQRSSRAPSVASTQTGVILKTDPPTKGQSFKKEPDCCETCCDILRNPISFGSIFLFFIGGLLGVISCVLVIIGVTVLDLYSGIALAIVGFLALFELKAIGTLETQILRIENSVNIFDDQCKCLTCKNDELRKEGEELHATISTITPQRDELEDNAKSLELKKTDLLETHQKAEKQNDIFQENVNKLFETRHKLSSKAEVLTNSVDELRDHMQKLDGVRKQLKEIIGDSDENFVELLKGMNSNYDRMENLVIENERILLKDTALRQEFKDHKDGLSKREFIRFTRLMPKKFRDIIKKENITFEKCKPNDADCLRSADINTLIEKLLALSQGESAVQFHLEDIGFL